MGYEMETISVGNVLRRTLVEPSPVGSGRRVEVTIEEAGSSVSAVLEVVVERSFADGSSDTLRMTAVELSASDPLMAEALAGNVGISVVALRGPNRVVKTYEYVDRQAPSERAGDREVADNETGNGETDTQTWFWLDQLLKSPVAFAGPIPHEALGEGSSWDVTFARSGRPADQGETKDRYLLSRLDSNRYVIEVSSLTLGRDISVVLEGTVGEPLPDRQEIVIGEPGTGQVVVTVVAGPLKTTG